MPRMPGTQLAPRSRMKLPIPRERNIIGLKPCLRTHTRARSTLTEREAETYERKAYIPHSQVRRTIWDSKDNYSSFGVSPLASRLFVPEESALTLFQLGVQRQLFSIRGLVGSNGAAALWQILMGDIGTGEQQHADMFEIPEWKPAALRRVRPRGLVDLSHVVTCPLGTYRSLFARLTVVKSRRSDPPEITLMFPFFGSFIGPARDKRVRRVAVWPPMDDPMGRSCDKHYARQRCASLSIRSARRTISRCRVCSLFLERNISLICLFL